MLRSKLAAAAKPALVTAGLASLAATTPNLYQKYQLYQSSLYKSTTPSTFSNTHHFTLASVQEDHLGYQPHQSPIFIPETDKERKAREKLEHETLQQLQQLQQQQSTPQPSKIHSGKSPASTGNSRLIDDGLQQIEVPTRIFPEWVPISSEEAREMGLLGFLRLPVEHLADFFRNRIDDISYLFTGEIRDQLLDLSRYEQSYEQKRQDIRFNPYYEAIYRGWYDTQAIKMKLAGNLPRFEYQPWLQRTQPRPKVYLDIVLNQNEAPTASKEAPVTPKRVVIQLYYDQLPKATENFIGLADGFIDGDRYLSFNQTLVHRIDKGHAFFAGDILARNGSSGMPFLPDKGKYLSDEKFNLPHDGPGCVVMDNNGPNTNSSHFFISQRAMPELTDRYMVVGHVIEGMDVVHAIDSIPVDAQGIPLYPVHIVESGVLIEDPIKDDPFHQFKKAIPEFQDRTIAKPTPPPSPCTSLQ